MQKPFKLPNIHTESPSFIKRQKRNLFSEPLNKDLFDDPEVPESDMIERPKALRDSFKKYERIMEGLGVAKHLAKKLRK